MPAAIWTHQGVNLKRGGILLIQISVGSLYMFSVSRGYIDGAFGLCTSMRTTLISAVHTAQMAVNTTKIIAGVVK